MARLLDPQRHAFLAGFVGVVGLLLISGAWVRLGSIATERMGLLVRKPLSLVSLIKFRLFCGGKFFLLFGLRFILTQILSVLQRFLLIFLLFVLLFLLGAQSHLIALLCDG